MHFVPCVLMERSTGEIEMWAGQPVGKVFTFFSPCISTLWVNHIFLLLLYSSKYT